MNPSTWKIVDGLLLADPPVPQQFDLWQRRYSPGASATNIKAAALLTKAQVAERVGVCPKQVERLVSAGRLPAVRLGRRCVRYRAADVEALIAGAVARAPQAPAAQQLAEA